MNITIKRLIDVSQQLKLQTADQFVLFNLAGYVDDGLIVDPSTRLPLSAADMAVKVGRTPHAVRRVLRRLCAVGLLHAAKIGNARVYRINEELFL